MMKVIKATVALMDEVDAAVIMKKLEYCGRVCHKSEDKISDTSAADFVRKLIELGHESVLEHVSVTFKIICDRGVMAELTRHRLASFSVESTRYCRYAELTFVEPLNLAGDAYVKWERAMEQTEYDYGYLLGNKVLPEDARAILPNCLKTEIIMTANLREWRHILKLRTSRAAHPQMRQVMMKVLAIFKERLPVVFEDIGCNCEQGVTCDTSKPDLTLEEVRAFIEKLNFTVRGSLDKAKISVKGVDEIRIDFDNKFRYGLFDASYRGIFEKALAKKFGSNIKVSAGVIP